MTYWYIVLLGRYIYITWRWYWNYFCNI